MNWTHNVLFRGEGPRPYVVQVLQEDIQISLHHQKAHFFVSLSDFQKEGDRDTSWKNFTQKVA